MAGERTRPFLLGPQKVEKKNIFVSFPNKIKKRRIFALAEYWHTPGKHYL